MAVHAPKPETRGDATNQKSSTCLSEKAMPDITPHLLFLQNGTPLLISHTSHITNIRRGKDQTRFTGVFSESLRRLSNGNLSQNDAVRLAQIERTHPWLEGLSQARTNLELADKLILGKELGMLFVELTAKCNERCIHCYANSSPERNESLSFDEIRSTLDQARALGRAFVQFTGGDPLIHPNLVEAVAHAHALNFAGIEIYTNGLLLSDALLNKLKPFTPNIAFSIYSHTASTHDRISGTAHSFQRTTEALRRAQNAGFEVRVGVALMEENARQLGQIRDYLVHTFNLNDSHIRFDPVKSIGRGINIENAEGIAYSVAHLPDRQRPSERTGKLCVGYDGIIYPCIFSRQSPLGSIRQNSLSEIIKSVNQKTLPAPSASRWQSCQERLSCSDCQMIAYALGESTDG